MDDLLVVDICPQHRVDTYACKHWQHKEWWQENNYLAGRPIGMGLWICLAEMAYTYRVMVCDPMSVYNFVCYPKPDLGLAIAAWALWDGNSEAPAGYTRDSRNH